MERKIYSLEELTAQWQSSYEFFGNRAQTPYRHKDALIKKVKDSGVSLINNTTWWPHYLEVGLIVKKEGSHQFALNFDSLELKINAVYKLHYPSVKEVKEPSVPVVKKTLADFSTAELIKELNHRGGYEIKEVQPNRRWVSIELGSKVQIIKEFVVK